MTASSEHPGDALAREVRLYVFRQAAENGRVPQAPQIAEALGRAPADIEETLKALAAGRALILAPNSSTIWAAAPFSAVPSGFRVAAGTVTYEAMCIWDALGIAALLGTDADVETFCGDCSERMSLTVRDRALMTREGIIHFGVPARRWWDNVGFT